MRNTRFSVCICARMICVYVYMHARTGALKKEKDKANEKKKEMAGKQVNLSTKRHITSLLYQ